jgi:hypothetical protein
VLEDHADAPAQRGDGLIDGIVVATLLTLLFLPVCMWPGTSFASRKRMLSKNECSRSSPVRQAPTVGFVSGFERVPGT